MMCCQAQWRDSVEGGTAPKNVYQSCTGVFMKGFLPVQVRYLFRTLPYRHTWRHKLWMLVQAVQLLVGYIRLKVTLRFSRGAAPIRGKTCVAVLLTHNRPQNMCL